MKKIPLRTCVVTKEKLEKRELARIVRTPEGNVIYDKSGKQNGKGAYLKKAKDVILKAKQSKILERYLEVPISDEVYEELLKEVCDE